MEVLKFREGTASLTTGRRVYEVQGCSHNRQTLVCFVFPGAAPINVQATIVNLPHPQLRSTTVLLVKQNSSSYFLAIVTFQGLCTTLEQ